MRVPSRAQLTDHVVARYPDDTVDVGSTADEAAAGNIAAVMSEFGLTPVSVNPVRNGNINESFFVDTGAGAYVLQRINRDVFADPHAVMSNLLVVHRFLHGDLVPTPVRTPDGRWLVEDDAGVWRLLERVPQADPPSFPTSGTVGRAGEFLGKLHARLGTLDPEELSVTLPGFHDPRRRFDQFQKIVAADPQGRAAVAGEEIAMAVAASELVVLAEALVAEVPWRVAHNDAKLDNFLFRGEDPVAIVDLDTLMPGQWFWDVGDLLRSATATAEEDEPDLDRVDVDLECFASVAAGYGEGVAGVAVASELEAIGAAGSIVTYEQALRFLTDWLAGDIYYRTSRPDQNLDRARNQFRLLGSMPHSPL